MDILSARGGYWVKDVSNQFPSVITVGKKHPLILRDGLIIWCGNLYEVKITQRETGGVKEVDDKTCVDVFYQREYFEKEKAMETEMEGDEEDQATMDFRARKKSKKSLKVDTMITLTDIYDPDNFHTFHV